MYGLMSVAGLILILSYLLERKFSKRVDIICDEIRECPCKECPMRNKKENL
jgi:hypothetical protein